jgi:RNA polymerase sigma-70 factor, ECF subfamily
MSLVEEMLKGNEKAIALFYREYSPKIVRFLRRKLPPQEIQEILNDVFFEAIDDLSKLKKTINLQAWLYKIAHNKMVDYYRKQKIKSFLFSQIPYLELLANEMHQPEFILEKNKIRDNIETAMKSLSKKYQHVLRMHYVDHLPVKQIALTLNLTPKATESLLFRARQQFIKVYERT